MAFGGPALPAGLNNILRYVFFGPLPLALAFAYFSSTGLCNFNSSNSDAYLSLFSFFIFYSYFFSRRRKSIIASGVQ